MQFLHRLARRLARGRAAIATLGTAAITVAVAACARDATPPTADTTADTRGGHIASITISPSSANGSVGESVQFSAKLYDGHGRVTNGSVTWSSTNTAVVSVTSSGYATGTGAGTAAVVASSGGASAQAPVTMTDSAPAIADPGAVTDLGVASVTDSSATLRFTQVTNGAGGAAAYDIRVAASPMTWWAATSVTNGTCATPVAGTTAGATLTCTVRGLTASTAYGFQLVAFRGTLNVDAAFGALSNVATATTAAAPDTTSPPPPPDTTSPPPPPPPPANAFFTEGFDNASTGSRGWYDNTNPAISTAEHTGSSTASLVFHWTPGATVPANGSAMRHKFSASNSMYVSYDVKYSANWVGSQKAYHPHEFYALSSWDGDWDGLSENWMTLYLEQNYQNGGRPRMAMQDNKAINTLLGVLPIDLTGITEDRSTGGCNGQVEANLVFECFAFAPWYNDKQITGPVTFQPTAGPGYKNNWNHVEAYFQLNTVQNGIGQADGVMQYWFNGTLVIDRHDILFRTGTRASLQLSQFVIGPYIGDGSPVDQTMWVDNLVVGPARN